MKPSSKPGFPRWIIGLYGFMTSRPITFAALAWLAISAGLGLKTALKYWPERKSSVDSRATALNFASISSSSAEFRTQSCFTSNCHGALISDSRPAEIRRDEYHVWMDDPHAKASRILLEKESEAIFQRLGISTPMPPRNDDSDDAKRHWKNCQACHDTNTHLTATKSVESVLASDHSNYFDEGVSCESCHGESKKWLRTHYGEGWGKKTSAEEKLELNLFSSSDLPNRIAQCATCHVGGGKGDVNHDLIAAGHPALKFEYTWYLSRLPWHWKSGRTVAAGNRSREWLIGQLVTAIAALKQLENRANACAKLDRLAQQSSWPELSEYNCFACHHDVSESSWRQQQRGFSGLDLKLKEKSHLAMPWGNWNLELIQILADQMKSPESIAFSTAFEKLDMMLQGMELPSAEATSAQSQIVSEKLQIWLKSCQSKDLDTDRLVREVVQNQQEKLVSSWDKTASVLLGISATHRNLTESTEQLKKAMNQLRLPADTDSPRDFRPEQVPDAAKGEDWSKLLKRLVEVPTTP